jgi:hypothetical protein
MVFVAREFRATTVVGSKEKLAQMHFGGCYGFWGAINVVGNGLRWGGFLILMTDLRAGFAGVIK